MMKRLAGCLMAAFLLTGLSASLAAQEGKNIRTILFVKVKPERRGDWRAAAKDFVAMKKKAGSDEYFSTWSSETGPDEYALVWYSAKWSELDEEEDPKTKGVEGEIASLLARFDGATLSMETWVDEIQPDMVYGMDSALPKKVRTSRTVVVADKMDVVLGLFRTALVPSMKKSGVATYGVAVARFGTAVNEVHTFASLNGWADFDSPWGLEKSLGKDGYKAFLDKVRPNVVSTQYDIWTFKPELSFLPEAK